MHHLQDKNIRDKIKSTNIQRYGCENPGSNVDVNNRRITTNLIRYGCENPMQNPDIAKKSAINRIHVSRYIFPENIKMKAIQRWNDKSYKNNDAQDETLQSKIEVNLTDCTMMMIYRRTASIFMNKYHKYGWDNRGRLCIGWVYQNTLIQLMTFGRAKDTMYTHQIYQICTHPCYIVPRGLYHIYRYAIKYFELQDLIFYEDAESDNHIGQELQLEYKSNIQPIKLWTYKDLIIPDDQIFNKDIMKLFHSVFQDKDTAMITHGWNCVYNKNFLVFVRSQTHTDHHRIHHNESDQLEI